MSHSDTNTDSETESRLGDGSISDTFSDSEDDTSKKLSRKSRDEETKWKLGSDDSEDENLIQDEKPLQLVRFMKPINGKGKLNMTIVDETLEKVLQSVGDRPLCPIILIGPPGHGKSFFANFVIRKLLSMEEADTDWIGWSDKTQPLTGFPWKVADKLKLFQGDGIYVWQHPFIINTQEGKVCVLLMECNGFQNDYLGSQEAQTSIFGLSFLMSSILIYTANACFATKEDFPNELFMPWIPYTKLGSKLSRDIEERTPFQNLSILIIDWSESGKYCFGAKDGKKFLNEQVNGLKDARARSYVQSSLKKFFSVFDCFLLPPAGEAINDKAFDGSLQHLPSDFAKKLEKYMDNLISVTTLPIKRIGNGTMCRNEFKIFFRSYLTLFNSYLQGQEKLSGSTLYNITIRTFNESVVGKCIEKYQSKFEWEQGEVCYLVEDLLNDSHNTATKKALEMFNNSTMRAGDKFENKQRLTAKMKEAFTGFQLENEKRRNNFITKHILEACQRYEEGLRKKISFQDEYTFHDEFEIGEKENILSAQVTEEFITKFNGESQENLLELDCKVKQKLSPIFDNLLHKNKQNKRQADGVMNSVVENLLARYKKEMNESISSDMQKPVIPQILQTYHKIHKEKIVRKFRKRDLPGSPSFQEPYFTKLCELMEGVFKVYLSGEQFKIEEKHNQTTILEKSLRLQYQQKLQNLLSGNNTVSEDDLRSFHSDLSIGILEEFKQKMPFNDGNPLGGNIIKKFVDDLETDFEHALKKQIKEKRKELETCKYAKTSSLQQYIDNMEKEKNYSGFIQEDDLVPTHEQFFGRALKTYDHLTNGCMEEVFSAEQRGILQEKILEEFQSFKTSNNLSQQCAESEAESLVKDLKKMYIDGMSLERVKTSDQLWEEHEKKMKETEKAFSAKFGSKGKQFNRKWGSKLAAAIDKKFSGLKREFEIKVAGEEVMFQNVIQRSRNFYHDQMKKECNNSPNINTYLLGALHFKITQDAIARGSKGLELTEGQRLQLSNSLEESFSKYKLEYTMCSGGEDRELAIGIDLGTTYCCVAVVQHKEVKIILNQEGELTTPSYVAVIENEDGTTDSVAGQQAKEDAYRYPENTIFDVKRIIGRRMDDVKLQNDIKFWPFKVVEENGVPKIKIHDTSHPPEQISAVLLSKLKKEVEERLGQPVSKAVITVPAYFNDGQRVATKDAGEMAGFEVLTILNEPTAAAIAYKVKQFKESSRRVLVFDLGGGTFDVAVLDTSCDSIDVLGVGGDTHLGGEDFDKNLMEHCVREFKKETKIDLLDDKESLDIHKKDAALRNLRRLQTTCEKAKHTLTSARQAKISIANFAAGFDLQVTITRRKFEEINMHLFKKTIEAVDSVLESAKVSKDDVNDIVMIGGSTKIPKVRELLKKHFNNMALDHSVNEDQAVAYGAAVQAALLNGPEGKSTFKFNTIRDVIPMSLGIEARLNGIDGRFSICIPKNTKIPHSVTRTYVTTFDYQDYMQITVYQGEDDEAKRNALLGEFTLWNIPLGRAGKEKVEVNMNVDAMGIVHVKAVCTSTKQFSEIIVTENRGRLTSDEKSHFMTKNAKPSKTEVKQQQITQLLNQLQHQYHQDLQKYLSDNDDATQTDIQRFHRIATSNILQDFKKKSQIHSGTLLGGQWNQSLRYKLDSKLEAAIVQWKQKAKLVCEHAKSVSLQLYADNMEQVKVEVGFIEEDELVSTHDKFFTSALDNYDKLTNPYKVEDFISEQRAILGADLQAKFESFKASNNLSQHSVELEAKSLVEEFMKLYADGMSLEGLKTRDELAKEHENVSKDCVRVHSEMTSSSEGGGGYQATDDEK